MNKKGNIGFRLKLAICFSFIMVNTTPTIIAQQEMESFPVQFRQYFLCYPIINPASQGATSENEIVLSYQRPISGFTGVSTYFLNVGFIPYKRRNGSHNKSIVGFNVCNDKEGAYINRSRFYGTYAFHTRITNSLNFSGGIAFGGMNYAIKSTPSTSGASSFAIDANSGIWLYNKKFHLGFSLNQLFGSSLKPLDEITYLPLHYNLSGSLLIFSNNMVEFRPHLLLTYPYYNQTSIQTSLYFLIFKQFIVVSGLNYKSDVSIMLGLKRLKIGQNVLSALISYSSSIKKESLGIKTMEMSLIYDFSPKKNR